ncbi:hypothetical protein FRX31_032909 [Thalictrum thalictroides]|uniref:Uncharacterized protein n=1 Tax=Thalictrum thalictroides TaxID=46969 RepID=A0A7J6UY03_THATH|nr:hypothetical protein FRX31_032909 [Thalictrum thalictroides]
MRNKRNLHGNVMKALLVRALSATVKVYKEKYQVNQKRIIGISLISANNDNYRKPTKILHNHSLASCLDETERDIHSSFASALDDVLLEVKLRRFTAYVSWLALIQPGSIEEHILFGNPMDKVEKFLLNETMKICSQRSSFTSTSKLENKSHNVLRVPFPITNKNDNSKYCYSKASLNRREGVAETCSIYSFVILEMVTNIYLHHNEK